MTFRPRALFITALFFIIISLIMCLKPSDSDFTSARTIIVMRSIGHQILLSSGDSSSRVLPVYKTGNDQYHITFGSTFEFASDSIVTIIQRTIEKNNLPADYLVNVVECQTNKVIFGFAIFKTENTNLVPCKGRKQPKACYAVNITFRDTTFSAINKNYIARAGSGLTALMLIVSGLRMSYRQKKTVINLEKAPTDAPEVISIGRYKFYTNGRYLEFEDKQIELSDKESKLLNILARRQNELVERSELQRVWEDEGVIVGRSLDMFISKIRKKLECDPTARVVNIHGKGYKLETI